MNKIIGDGANKIKTSKVYFENNDDALQEMRDPDQSSPNILAPSTSMSNGINTFELK